MEMVPEGHCRRQKQRDLCSCGSSVHLRESMAFFTSSSLQSTGDNFSRFGGCSSPVARRHLPFCFLQCFFSRCQAPELCSWEAVCHTAGKQGYSLTAWAPGAAQVCEDLEASPAQRACCSLIFSNYNKSC